MWAGPTLLCWGGANIKELSNTVDEQVKASKKDPKAPERYKVKTAVADGQPVTLDAAKVHADPRGGGGRRAGTPSSGRGRRCWAA